MTRITTPFGFHSTAAEVVEGIDLSGQRMIVTGAASGIGIETARALAGAGAEVTMAVRDVEAGARMAAEIGGEKRRLHVARLDLADRGLQRGGGGRGQQGRNGWGGAVRA
jgi:NAD(P)-dependent dehydrogenase (short-subunit alcohol dehydrogenase family)